LRFSFLFACGYVIMLELARERLSFSCCICTPVKLNCLYVCGLLLVSLFWPTALCACPCAHNTQSFLVATYDLKLGTAIALYSSFQNCSHFAISFAFPYKVWNKLIYIFKNSCWDFAGTCINTRSSERKNNIFTKLSLSVNEHGMHLCLFRLWFLSLVFCSF
jgi:hypothetical protein